MHRRIAGLDLIRGFAIGLVMLRHALPSVFGQAGTIGVVLFFTLSGYLITGILARDIEKFGRVRYGRFYRNRALRLLPALIFVLVVFTMVTWLLDPIGEREGLGLALFSSITYTMNLPFDHGTSALGHLWTLATEEQFYLLWPLVLTLGLRRERPGRLIGWSAVVIIAALVGTAVLYGDDLSALYPLPTSWAIAMVIGAAAFLYQGRLRRLIPCSDRWKNVLLAALVSLTSIACLLPSAKDNFATYLIGGPLIAFVAVGLIFTLERWVELPSPLFRPLLWLGTISYAAYLWNLLLTSWFDSIGGAAARIAATVLTIVMAAISLRVVELPALKWKDRFDQRAIGRAAVDSGQSSSAIDRGEQPESADRQPKPSG